MKIVLKDGSVKEYDRNVTCIEVAKDISEGLARNACVALINGEVKDLRTEIKEDCNLEILDFNDKRGQDAFNHTAAHIFSQAVKRLYPTCKLAIGPAIKNGFYYDVDFEEKITTEDLAKIEEEMKKML